MVQVTGIPSVCLRSGGFSSLSGHYIKLCTKEKEVQRLERELECAQMDVKKLRDKLGLSVTAARSSSKQLRTSLKREIKCSRREPRRQPMKYVVVMRRAESFGDLQ